MNIESPKFKQTNETQQQTQSKPQNNSDVKFADELKDLKSTENNIEGVEEVITSEDAAVMTREGVLGEDIAIQNKPKDDIETLQVSNQNLNQAQEGTLPDVVQDEEHIIGSAINDLTSVLNKIKNPNEQVEQEEKPDNIKLNLPNEILPDLNQKDDIKTSELKPFKEFDDNDKEEGKILINNDFNIDNKDKLPQMTPNMNFGGDGQPFSSFMNNESEHRQSEQKLSTSAKDLAEEAAILSTMAENIAMANKAMVEEPESKVVTKNDGIKKVDTKTNIVQETIVKYDTVVMNEADVEVFADLVQKGEVDMNNLAPEAAQKSVHVSKTLADMLAKAMEDNKPVRIEFDNGISVIIKISRDGKLSADFLPSTQVAEAYLKENLPLLKQKFDEQNLDYDELNQRERRNQDREQNRKKGRENE